ncbi:hypothetical protein ACJJTC_018018 [Scirpophaga incertulas]
MNASLLKTYNPLYFEQYVDSSDFDDDDSVIESNAKINKENMEKTQSKIYCFDSQDIKPRSTSNKIENLSKYEALHQCACKGCILSAHRNARTEEIPHLRRKVNGKSSTKSEKTRSIQSSQSKLSLRYKIMPCLSNIFHRSHPKLSEFTNDKNIQSFTKDNYCQVYSCYCDYKSPGKYNKRNNKDVQYPYSAADLYEPYPMLSSRNNLLSAKGHCLKMESNIDTNAKNLRSDNFDGPNLSTASNSSVFWDYLAYRLYNKILNGNRNSAYKRCSCLNSPQAPCESNEALRNEILTGVSRAHKRSTHNKIVQSSVLEQGVTSNVHQKETHDDIKESLKRHYNGEILCIHNPPCVLINGCLNMSATEGKFSSMALPAYKGADTLKKLRQSDFTEQACQYQKSNLEVLQCNILENKTDKMTQSICNHNPPCKVVRSCYKSNMDCNLQTFCEHDQMCSKLTGCLLDDSKSDSIKCIHVSKCREIPVFKEKNRKLVLMATDNVGTQVKSAFKAECRHDPPCIMIPRCLGRLMREGYVPYGAIPSCSHHPTCDLIPACCRKSTKMVSVYCQYPSPCRIV